MPTLSTTPRRPHPRNRPAVLAAATLAGALALAGCRANDAPPPELPIDDPVDTGEAAPDVRTIDETGTDPIETPLTPAGAETEAVSVGPATRPAQVASATTEGYRTVGGVLSEINGRPIYAGDVIDARANQLRALALRLSPVEFEREAVRILLDEARDRQRDQVLLSVFERGVSRAERQQARMLTMLWRRAFITDQGGSEAEARRAALDRFGMTLEELGEDEYRRRLSRIFIQKYVAPRVRPGAQELREEYDRRRQRGDFDQPGGIEFSLIEVRPESGDEVAIVSALARARDLHRRAAAGEDFAQLARKHSDNPSYAARGGRPPEWLLPLAPGSYAIADVDRAAWDTPAGEIAPLVTVGQGPDQVHYVVRVDEKREARTLPFVDVQIDLANEMANAEQNRILGEYFRNELERIDAPTPEQERSMIATAVELVMQRYEDWRQDATTTAAD